MTEIWTYVIGWFVGFLTGICIEKSFEQERKKNKAMEGQE